ncbi:hypothetical protein L596_011669 [Steinernema carpocapsae]|uniref:Peptidase A1 domain-containing protein n=1 Tax=Steinernema carpocapsae TaxID=34508 RepID=A0A4U5NV17_STECR|nr:hypothetical protein L596_011669 [Steinernema carpocapsae]
MLWMLRIVVFATLVTVLNAAVFRHKIASAGSLRSKLVVAEKWVDEVVKIMKVKASGSQHFIDYYDNFYLGNITLGTPAQPFIIVLDTGRHRKLQGHQLQMHVSGLSILRISKEFLRRGKIVRCKQWQYCHRRKITATGGKPTATCHFFHCHCHCLPKLGADTLSFGGLTYSTQKFGIANNVADFFGRQPVDGILGLGWPALAVHNVVPPMQNVLNQLDQPLFTVWMDRHVKQTQGCNGGLITYGAVDTQNCDSQVNYVPLTSLTY